ncbi:NADH-quinone oxidoreductase subunit J family protein [Mucilaginibacter arboris]|uniref:NADH-quinone oxidoreductase subunit J n=1 Tax=Mucilaginibacter arboris TaxID=2682090 RepID=A0A7K1SUH5_9SPHI|nr:NADH-quinone oxidoreductase subunit J [Mucilaginibacter arboris]MVN20913.1 NADH-quinone oxidoreductase subunit J [Mucilaginibacter arboris]
MEQGIFIFLALVTIASACFVAASNNLVRSVFMFFVTLFAVAGLYVFALADFVAVTQIVIYVGGVLVLMLFTFMLSSKETLEKLERSKQPFFTLKQFPALLVAAGFLIVLVNAVTKLHPNQLTWVINAQNNTFHPQDNTVTNIGINLMTAYLLPFEAISILLMMALIGAAHLARKEQGND